MQTTPLPHQHSSSRGNDAGRVAAQAALASIPGASRIKAAEPGALTSGAVVKQQRRSLDTLLEPSIQPRHGAVAEPVLDEKPGVGAFLGLRFALMFNAGVGIAALLTYEVWSMLAQ